MSIKDVDYYLGNQEEFDALTDEERNRLLISGQLEFPEGDTEATAQADKETLPADATKTEELAAAPEAAKDDAAAQPGNSNAEPEVLTRDGKHTIPFSELQKARDSASHWEQVAKDQQSLLDQLQAAKEADEGTGKTENQDEVLAGLKDDYPELAELLAPAVQKLVDVGVAKQVQVLEAKLNQALQPLQETAQKSAQEVHFKTIEDAHPDYEQILAGEQLSEWIAKQPSFLRDSYNAVLNQGTAPQVVELFQAFKDATGVKPISQRDLADKAKQAIDKAAQAVPASLSDIPAGSKAPHDEAEAMLNMTGVSLMEKLANKSPAEIEALLNRVI